MYLSAMRHKNSKDKNIVFEIFTYVYVGALGLGYHNNNKNISRGQIFFCYFSFYCQYLKPIGKVLD